MYDQLYRESRRRIGDLLSAFGPDEFALAVPACPLWTVQDVLAHLAGATDAHANGSDGVPGSDPWTQAQVEARRGRTPAELFAEWLRWAPAVEQTPLSSRSWLPILHDTLSHEADLRGAVGAPQLPADALAASFPLLDIPIQRRLAPLAPVLLDLDQQRIEVGLSDNGQTLTVEASRYEFWRAWFGRRSEAQMRGWVRSGNADLFAKTLPVFPARPTDLTEPG